MPAKKTDYSHTEIKDVNGNLKEIVLAPSTIETIDKALFEYVDQTLNLHANTSKGWKKTPVIWVSSERAFQIKNNKDIRDSSGVLKLPLITLERTSMTKDPSFRGTFTAHFPNASNDYYRVKRINTPAARRIGQEKTSNFRNAQSARKYGAVGNPEVGHGQVNFPSFKTDKSRVVFETIYQPIPIWVNTMYSLKVRTEYVQQMNELVQPFYARTGQANSFFINQEGHRYESFVEGDIGQSNNVSSLGEEERTYITEINLKVLGYLMGEGPNDDRPKITIVENAVDVKIPRERVIMGDINTFLKETDEGKGFYRE